MLARLLVADYAARTCGENFGKRVSGYAGYLLATVSDEGPKSKLDAFVKGIERQRRRWP